MAADLEALLNEVRACTRCAARLPRPPRPVLQAGDAARILVIGQAPGRLAHESATPWNDPSGDELRRWLAVDRATFYDPDLFALTPMGFCYPGKGKGGDLPPRPECAPLWHAQIFARLEAVRLVLLVGAYAIRARLEGAGKRSLSAVVRAHDVARDREIPLPHPSPRTFAWRRDRPWFEDEILPILRFRVAAALGEF